MGEMRVPVDALYGPQTQRAVENFPISGLRLPRAFIRALGLIKACAAQCERPAGEWRQAALEVAEGKYDESIRRRRVPDRQRHVDEHERERGDRPSRKCASERSRQSGPVEQRRDSDGDSRRGGASGTRIAAAGDAIVSRQRSKRKAREFHDVIKIGRTHLQDAVPMRLGQEFSGYAAQVRSLHRARRGSAAGHLRIASRRHGRRDGSERPARVCRRRRSDCSSERTGLPFREARNHFEAQASKDAVVFLSAALRNYAVSLTKIANDIRWLGSGPRCGLGELKVPATQPGSSIMPGKVNPVIAESVLMVCAQVIGYDATIAWCGAAGNFELNVMMPVMAYDLLQSIELLAAASRNFETRLIAGLEADAERASSLVEQSLAMVTVLAPEIGYEKAAAISKEAYTTGRTVREVAREKSGIPEDRLNELLNPESQAGGAAE